MSPSGCLPAWQRPFSGSCRRMASTSRKAPCAGAAGNPGSSSGKEKNLVPEPPCGHVQAGPAALPPLAPGRGRRAWRPSSPASGRQPPASHPWREAQSAALSSSHPPANPRDKVGTETRRASVALGQRQLQNCMGTHRHARPWLHRCKTHIHTHHTHTQTHRHRHRHTHTHTHTDLPTERWLPQTLFCPRPEKMREVGVGGVGTSPRAGTMGRATVGGCPTRRVPHPILQYQWVPEEPMTTDHPSPVSMKGSEDRYRVTLTGPWGCGETKERKSLQVWRETWQPRLGPQPPWKSFQDLTLILPAGMGEDFSMGITLAFCLCLKPN